MDELWKLRHRSSDLMGTVLNVNSGTWVRRDSGVGAGIDSYYEYCLKAYVLLGQDRYLSRFNKVNTTLIFIEQVKSCFCFVYIFDGYGQSCLLVFMEWGSWVRHYSVFQVKLAT